MFTTSIIPVIVINDSRRAKQLGETLVANQLPVAEVTLRTDAALDSIREMRKVTNLEVGAGTVLTVEQAKDAIEAGATFLVSPGMHEDVITYAQTQNIPVIPGTITPSEIAKAISLGLNTVKFFPAEAAGGAKLLKALGSVYPHVKVMPTGGITPNNLGDYLSLPNVLACGGSWMVPEQLISEGQFEEIGTLIRDAVELSQQPSA